MSWVVDTCVLIDILVNDPTFGRSSALCLKRNLSKGLEPLHCKKRLQDVPKRPVADVMIGAFSSRFDGLITRNQNDFTPWFPKMKLIVPDNPKS